MNGKASSEAIKESAAETRVLEVLASGPLFGIEVAPEENRRPGEPAPISRALERCLATGWVQSGPANSPDWRMHLSAAGCAELSRREQEARRVPVPSVEDQSAMGESFGENERRPGR